MALQIRFSRSRHLQWPAALLSACQVLLLDSTVVTMHVQVGEAKKGDGLAARPTVLQKRRLTEQLFGANRLTSTSFTVPSWEDISVIA